MKKSILFALAIAATAAVATAAPLDSKGIPADASGIIHIDLDLCAKSAISAAVKQFSQKALSGKKSGQDDYERFKKQTGIDPEKDISGVTVGIFKPANDSHMLPGVAVVRGVFSPDKIIAAAKENNCPVITRDALTLIDISGLAFAQQRTQTPFAGITFTLQRSQTSFAGIVGKNVILLGETADVVEKAAAALSGNAGSYAPPATLDIFGKQEGASLILAYLAGDLAKGGDSSMPLAKAERRRRDHRAGTGGDFSMPLAKAENILLALGEKGSSLRARIFSEYATPEAARKTQAAVQMLVGLMQMGAANSDSPDAEARIQSLQRLINSLKINLSGKSLDITADYPVADIIEQIKKYDAGE